MNGRIRNLASRLLSWNGLLSPLAPVQAEAGRAGTR